MTAQSTGYGPRGEIFVDVDSWQQQCCGDDFEVGSDVAWQVQTAPDPSGWLGSILPPDSGLVVLLHEERHGTGEPTLPFHGTVVSIRTLHYDLESIPGEIRGYRPKPGTGRLESVRSCDPWGPERHYPRGVEPTTAFGGWVVGIVPDAESAAAVARSMTWTP